MVKLSVVCVAEGHLSFLFQPVLGHDLVCVSSGVVLSECAQFWYSVRAYPERAMVFLAGPRSVWGPTKNHSYPGCCLSPKPLLSWISQDCKPSWTNVAWYVESKNSTAVGCLGSGCQSKGSVRHCFKRQWNRRMCSVWNLMGPSCVYFVIFWEKR